MAKSLIPLSDGSFVEGEPLEPAAFNAVSVPPQYPNMLPDEPSTLALAFVGISILAVYAGLQRSRKQSQTTLRMPKTSSADKKGAAAQQRRGAA